MSKTQSSNMDHSSFIPHKIVSFLFGGPYSDKNGSGRIKFESSILGIGLGIRVSFLISYSL